MYLLILGCTGSSLLCAGYALVLVHGLHIVVASQVADHRLSGLQAQKLWHKSLVALQHVESS